MIIKDKNIQHANSAQAKAGIKQELDVAFYLRRAFKDHEQVFVFNDLKFSHKQETAQIVTLVTPLPFGMYLTSGSPPILPTSITLFTPFAMIYYPTVTTNYKSILFYLCMMSVQGKRSFRG